MAGDPSRAGFVGGRHRRRPRPRPARALCEAAGFTGLPLVRYYRRLDG